MAVLFGVAGVHDAEPASRSLVRLASPLVELGLAGLLCAGCLRLARRGHRIAWLTVSAAIGVTVGLVYFAQAYSLYLSHNFISVLALENTDSAAFVDSNRLKASLLLAVLWIGLFCIASAVASRSGPAFQGRAIHWGLRRFGISTAGCALLFTYLLFLQGDGNRLEPGFRQSPVANLIVTVYRVRFPPVQDAALEQADEAGESPARCFRYAGGHDGVPGRAAMDYPFLRTRAYAAPLPFPARPEASADRPNIIVIFAEGISARMIGSYGGRYAGLTPNIDVLAARSMKVDDYFNHTAATYRGLTGQLSSGFSFAGGSGKDGWIQPENQSALTGIRRQTLPYLVNDHGYESHFFAPHKQNRPIIRMLHSLGFDEVHASESIRDRLNGKVAGRPGTGAIDDQSLFRGLVSFLREHEDERGDDPFFIGIYNIGTHAFLKNSANDVAYGNGANPVLNKLHNYDAALGSFLRYFLSSPFADNTVLVFTSDHATYPEPAYREVAGDDLKPYFVDRIPLLVLDPYHSLPATLDAQGRNSLDLAPTILQLTGLQSGVNAFLGSSLFEARNFPAGITAMGPSFYLTTPEGLFPAGEVPSELQDVFDCEVQVVRHFYKAEQMNRIVPSDRRLAGPTSAKTGCGSTAGECAGP